MHPTSIIKWPGKSGVLYTYCIYDIDTRFKKGPCNYIFAKRTDGQKWCPTYIGETGNLGNRAANHVQEKCARRNGATHIHVHKAFDEHARLTEKDDLVALWQPTCN